MAIAPVLSYGKMPRNVITSLKPMAGHLLTVIVCLIDRRKNQLERSLAALAADANMSKDSIIKYTRLLENSGFLKVRRKPGGKHDDINVYSLAGEVAQVALFNASETTKHTSRRNRQQMSEKSTADVGEIDTDSNAFIFEEEDISNGSFSEENPDSDSGEHEVLGEGEDPTLPEQDAPMHQLEAIVTGKQNHY